MNGFVYRIGSTTNVLGKPPHFYNSMDLGRARCTFASVYAVREEDAKAICEAGTAAGFRGIVWSQKLWVDFDNTEAAESAKTYLKEQEIGHVIYETGNRGCHIGIDRVANPSHLLPAQDKAWVQEHLPGADLGLYWHLHLIRLPGTVHEATGRAKRLVTNCNGKAIVLKPFAAEAVIPSLDLGTSVRPSVFSVWEVASKLTAEPHKSRHKHLVDLAVALKNNAKVTKEEALWVVGEVNRGFHEPKGPTELEQIVSWAYGN